MKSFSRLVVLTVGFILSADIMATEVTSGMRQVLSEYVENELARKSLSEKHAQLEQRLKQEKLDESQREEIKLQLESIEQQNNQELLEANSISKRYASLAKMPENQGVGIASVGCGSRPKQVFFTTKSRAQELTRAVYRFYASQLDLEQIHSVISQRKSINIYDTLLFLEEDKRVPHYINDLGRIKIENDPEVVEFSSAPHGPSSVSGPQYIGDRMEMHQMDHFGLEGCGGFSTPFVEDSEDGCLVGVLTVCGNIFSRPKCLSCYGFCLDFFGQDKTCKNGCSSVLSFANCDCR